MVDHPTRHPPTAVDLSHAVIKSHIDFAVTKFANRFPVASDRAAIQAHLDLTRVPFSTLIEFRFRVITAF